MRVNLISQPSSPYYRGMRSIPVSLTIRPSCGLPGDYQFPTDSASLLRLLRRTTDLPSTVLQRFEGDLFGSAPAKLLGVELSDRCLTEIGYFID